ncbi:very short patch repair endonuclease [Kitasatospora indigofera]|uniref:very short patch repair endonuclease n=1 Tax=Kitasatospora indigofera TaxID=67307 RepID=UPI0036BDC39B
MPANRTAPIASSASVAARMSRQRSRDTAQEIAVRKLLHSQGLRYRVNLPVPGMRRRTIDIAFTRRKVAVFLDGCFWHGCPEHGTSPRANGAWWQEKLARNAERDAETTIRLEAEGWLVLRFWEHQPPATVADMVTGAVSATDPSTSTGGTAVPSATDD